MADLPTSASLGLCKHGERQKEPGCSDGDGGMWRCWTVQNQAGNKMSLCLSLLLNYNTDLPNSATSQLLLWGLISCLVRWGQAGMP